MKEGSGKRSRGAGGAVAEERNKRNSPGGKIRNGNADGIVGLEMLMAVGLRTHVQGTRR